MARKAANVRGYPSDETINWRPAVGPYPPDLDQRIAAIRYFNRFYTKRIGVLEEGLLKSTFSLTEVRVLYELAHRDNLAASMLRKELGLDAGYLSRILQDFQKRGLIAKSQSKSDGRQTSSN
jgi:DNA-binding MarR family transcriptional regulator